MKERKRRKDERERETEEWRDGMKLQTETGRREGIKEGKRKEGRKVRRREK